MNETHAIRLCLKYKDPSGFEFLVKKYRREAYVHAIGFLGNPDDAADACQESFSRAFSKMPLLEGMTEFYPWFYTILRNYCLNAIKRHKTVSTHRQSQTQSDLDSAASYDPRLIISGDEEKTLVWQVLESLTPEFREILILKYIQGYSYDDIATLSAIPRGTVMSRLYHARKAFSQNYDSGSVQKCHGHSS